MADDAAPHRRRWPWVVGLVVAVVLVAVAVPVVLFATRERPEGKDLGEAVDEYQPGSSTAAGGPTPGVYRATGEGTEAISLPPVSQHDGAVVPVTVEAADDGCWRVEAAYHEAHRQDWTFCEQPGGGGAGEGAAPVVVDRGGQTYQRWDFGATSVENTSTFTCDPPAVMIDPSAEPGDTWDQHCTGTNTQTDGTTISAGTYEFVGVEDLEIDGEAVPARRYRQDRTISGAQTGTDAVDVWFAVADHLPLRMARDVRIDSDSPVGTVTYTESGWWQLDSLVPETA